MAQPPPPPGYVSFSTFANSGPQSQTLPSPLVDSTMISPVRLGICKHLDHLRKLSEVIPGPCRVCSSPQPQRLWKSSSFCSAYQPHLCYLPSPARIDFETYTLILSINQSSTKFSTHYVHIALSGEVLHSEGKKEKEKEKKGEEKRREKRETKNATFW